MQNGCQELSGATPIGRRILLWFVGNNAPRVAHCQIIGTISALEEGKVWDGETYRPIEWFSFWQHLPGPPSLDYLESNSSLGNAAEKP